MKYFVVVILIVIMSSGSAFCDRIIMTTSEWTSEYGNVAVFDETSKSFTDEVFVPHQDSFVRTDGEYLYILEGGAYSNLMKFNPDDLSTPVYQYSLKNEDDSGSNPHDIVFVGEKAYLMRYNSDEIWVVNPNTVSEEKFKTGEIDIFTWADDDGSPEAHTAFMYNGLLYVVLQRYSMQTYSAGTAVIIVIDPETDEIIDQDLDEEGIQGVDLILRNPYGGSLLGSKLYLACGTSSIGETDSGVMVMDLEDMANSQRILISQETAGAAVCGLKIFSEEYALLFTFNENWNATARKFNVSDGTIGETFPVTDLFAIPGEPYPSIVACNGLLYAGSRNAIEPGLYVVDPRIDEPVVQFYPTTIGVYSIVAIGEGTGVGVENDQAPAAFDLKPAYPNPFNPTTTISFNIEKASNVIVEVYNIGGQKVDTLFNGLANIGTHSLYWDASNMATGVYYINVTAGRKTKTTGVTLIK